MTYCYRSITSTRVSLQWYCRMPATDTAISYRVVNPQHLYSDTTGMAGYGWYALLMHRIVAYILQNHACSMHISRYLATIDIIIHLVWLVNSEYASSSPAILDQKVQCFVFVTTGLIYLYLPVSLLFFSQYLNLNLSLSSCRPPLLVSLLLITLITCFVLNIRLFNMHTSTVRAVKKTQIRFCVHFK